MTKQELATALEAKHPMRRWRVRLYRDNRWDVYPDRQPIEEVEVNCRRKENVADAIIEQCAKWRSGGFCLASIEEIPLALSQQCRIHGLHGDACPRENTLGTSPCMCVCHGNR